MCCTCSSVRNVQASSNSLIIINIWNLIEYINRWCTSHFSFSKWRRRVVFTFIYPITFHVCPVSWYIYFNVIPYSFAHSMYGQTDMRNRHHMNNNVQYNSNERAHEIIWVNAKPPLLLQRRAYIANHKSTNEILLYRSLISIGVNEQFFFGSSMITTSK